MRAMKLIKFFPNFLINHTLVFTKFLINHTLVFSLYFHFNRILLSRFNFFQFILFLVINFLLFLACSPTISHSEGTDIFFNFIVKECEKGNTDNNLFFRSIMEEAKKNPEILANNPELQKIFHNGAVPYALPDSPQHPRDAYENYDPEKGSKERDDLISLLSFIRPPFDSAKEVYSLVSLYVAEARDNPDASALDLVLNIFPRLESAEMFSHPIMRPYSHAPMTNAENVINNFHESYYLNVEIRKDICYILAVFKIYATCGHDGLSTIETHNYINNLTDEQFNEVIRKTYIRLEEYVTARKKLIP